MPRDFAAARSICRPLLALGLLCFGLGSCATPSARHPLAGKIRPGKGEASYAIYSDDDWLYVRVAGGDSPHRFQGSVTALRGNIGALELDRPGLAEQVATRGASIQFDIESASGGAEGFRARIARTCLRFDLYVDGSRRPERVRLGGRGETPKQIPFERCP